MKARIHEHDGWWWAWTFTTGWPRGLRRCYRKRNEHDDRVWHVGVVFLGYSLEVRFGF